MLLLLLLMTTVPVTVLGQVSVSLDHVIPGSEFDANIYVDYSKTTVLPQGWTLHLMFSQPVDRIEGNWWGTIESVSDDKTHYILTGTNAIYPESQVSLEFHGRGNVDDTLKITAYIEELTPGSTTHQPECARGFYKLAASVGGSECRQCGAGCLDDCRDIDALCQCLPGWQTPTCQHCSEGLWGDNCDNQCPDQCLAGHCDRLRGCTQCAGHFNGQNCTECAPGRYGHNCQQHCSAGCTSTTCDQHDGSCSCRAGWTGHMCDSCASGHYGHDCQQQCSAGCNTTSCDQHDGSCSCRPGWRGHTCDTCEAGYYGPDCGEQCSVGCHGHCDNHNGTCTCRSGWSGDKCDVCVLGFYKFTTSAGQPECRQCGAGCLVGGCADGDGHCQCIPGWQPPTCQQCAVDYYGQDCTSVCSAGCLGDCDKDNGTCTCRPGWSGDRCDAQSSAGPVIMPALLSLTTTHPHPSATTPHSNAAGSETTTGTGGAPLSGSKCYTCGDLDNKHACTRSELRPLQTVPCPDDKPYCMNDIYQVAGQAASFYKRCVDEATCKQEWYIESSDKQYCFAYDPAVYRDDLVCHPCCYGDECNHDLVPNSTTLYKP